MAILRAEPAYALPQVVSSLVDVGIDTVEIPVTVPGAIAALRETKRQLGKAVCLGAGSVLDASTVAAARDVGCEYVVSPVVDVELIEHCNRYGVPMLAGALTPTEILTAWEAGCPLVKVFPGDVGGCGWIRDLSGPLPQVQFLPTGGVSKQNAADYLNAGASALGVGSAIAPKQAILNRDWAAIRQAAAEFVAAMNVDNSCDSSADRELK